MKYLTVTWTQDVGMNLGGSCGYAVCSNIYWVYFEILILFKEIISVNFLYVFILILINYFQSCFFSFAQNFLSLASILLFSLRQSLNSWSRLWMLSSFSIITTTTLLLRLVAVLNSSLVHSDLTQSLLSRIRVLRLLLTLPTI